MTQRFSIREEIFTLRSSLKKLVLCLNMPAKTGIVCFGDHIFFEVVNRA